MEPPLSRAVCPACPDSAAGRAEVSPAAPGECLCPQACVCTPGEWPCPQGYVCTPWECLQGRVCFCIPGECPCLQGGVYLHTLGLSFCKGVCAHLGSVCIRRGVCVHTRGVSVSTGVCLCLQGCVCTPGVAVALLSCRLLGSAPPQGLAAAVVLPPGQRVGGLQGGRTCRGTAFKTLILRPGDIKACGECVCLVWGLIHP